MTKEPARVGRVNTKFYLMKEGWGREDMLMQSKVMRGPERFQGLGEVYAGEFVPDMFATLFGLDSPDSAAYRAHFAKYANAALFIEMHGRTFGLDIGPWTKLINKRAVERKFGLKVALKAIRPALHDSNPDPLDDSKNVLRLQYDGGTKSLWDITHMNQDVKSLLTRSLTGYTRKEYKGILSSWIRGASGVSVYAKQDLSDLPAILDLAYQLYKDMDAAVLDDDQLANLACEMGWTEIHKVKEGGTIPSTTELMAYTIRQMVGMDRPVTPVELYAPVARSCGLSVMEPNYVGKKQSRWALKRLVRYNLEEGVELGLLNQNVKTGRYTVTPIGKELSFKHEKFTEQILNQLCAKQIQLHGSTVKPGRLVTRQSP